jgi:hypothetical protein
MARGDPRTPCVKSAERITGRAWRIQEIQRIWYDDFLRYWPPTALPVPPLAYVPWPGAAWDYEYRTWRDAVTLMVMRARLDHLDSDPVVVRALCLSLCRPSARSLLLVISRVCLEGFTYRSYPFEQVHVFPLVPYVSASSIRYGVICFWMELGYFSKSGGYLPYVMQ